MWSYFYFDDCNLSYFCLVKHFLNNSVQTNSLYLIDRKLMKTECTQKDNV